MGCGYHASWRYLYVLAACFQNFTCGGLLFGWASLSSTMFLSSDGGPGLDRDKIHTMFVWASTVNFLSPLLLGVILDWGGPRASSVMSIMCIIAGCLLFGFSSKTIDMFIIGMCLIAFGGPGVQNAIIHLSNLFPQCKATTTSVITGSFGLSFIVFQVFEFLWWKCNVDYKQIFVGYCIVLVVNVVISLTLWPDTPYDFAEQLHAVHSEQRRKASIAEQSSFIGAHVSDAKAEEEDSSDEEDVKIGAVRLPSRFIRNTADVAMRRRTTEAAPLSKPSVQTQVQPVNEFVPPPPVLGDLKHATLTRQICSGPFLGLALFFSVCAFWANFYVGTVDIQLGDGLDLSAAETHNYVRLFTVCITGGTLAIPFVGATMDRLGFPATSFITVVCAVLFSAFALKQNAAYVIPAFVFYSLYRTFLFTFFFAYLADTLGFKYFGVLAGILFAVAGVLGILQSPLNDWAKGTCHESSSSGCTKGRWQAVNLIQTVTLAACVLFSIADRQHRAHVQLHAESHEPGEQKPHSVKSYGTTKTSHSRYAKLPNELNI